MFYERIINGMPEIIKFFQELKIDKQFNKPQLRHLQSFLIAILLQGYQGKVTNVSELAHNACRTSVGRFLNNSKWEDSYLFEQLQARAVKKIWAKSAESGLPIYIIIDDTICEKTVPSSKVKYPIAGCGFHQSHLLNKTVYGYQYVTVMLRCADMVLPYDTILYRKGKDSKIQIAKRVIYSLPEPVAKGYVLTDSWYSCQELFETALKSGYHYIATLKSNRKIYPKGHRRNGIQVGKFARALKVSDFDVVTINGHSYHIYTYLGKINGLPKSLFRISYPLHNYLSQQAQAWSHRPQYCHCQSNNIRISVLYQRLHCKRYTLLCSILFCHMFWSF